MGDKQKKHKAKLCTTEMEWREHFESKPTDNLIEGLDQGGVGGHDALVRDILHKRGYDDEKIEKEAKRLQKIFEDKMRKKQEEHERKRIEEWSKRKYWWTRDFIRYALIVFLLTISFVNIKNTMEIFKFVVIEFKIIEFLAIVFCVWFFMFSRFSPIKKVINFEYNGDDVCIYHGYPIPMGYIEIRTGMDFVFPLLVMFIIYGLNFFLILNIFLFPIVIFVKCLLVSCF